MSAKKKEKVYRIFEVSGTYREKGTEKPFKRKITAFNSNFAAEKTMALIGSEHKVKRRHIHLNEVTESKEA